ncbi:hypothetical protein CHUAL_001023 [Chamberlinius hualienensis]
MDNEGETVYVTHDDPHLVMTEGVKSLASSIYQEFERMIQKYDHDVVKDLMPLVVNVLECLDVANTENQEHEVELELLKEDNEQLMTQYEREKQLRKTSEQKVLEYEDVAEEEKKNLQSKVESLESIVRMLELKSKNASDHVSRLEEKEAEMKKEYNKLHERYTELFKTHVDYMERTKILFGTDRLEQLIVPKSRQNMNFSQTRSGSTPLYSLNSIDTPLKSLGSPVEYPSITSPVRSSDSNASLHCEIQDSQSHTIPPDLGAETDSNLNRKSSKDNMDKEVWDHIHSPDEMADITPENDLDDLTQDEGIGTGIRSQRTANTLYQELSFQEPETMGEVDESMDITAESDNDQNDFSDTDSEGQDKRKYEDGMGKEVENLILENNELLATKNALNIVKDDLIAKVDELSGEHEILRQEIHSIQAVKTRLQLRVRELEDELRQLRSEAENNAKNNKSDDEDVPMAQRKRFTRVEMARVLMERNQYKERFMELQEAVRWTEMIRASRSDPALESKKSRSTIWKFFSNLFSASEKPQGKPMPYVNVRYNAPSHHVSPALDTMRKKNLNDRRKGLDFMDNELSSEKLQQQRARERREQYKQVRAHVKKDDGRMQAYGWSLPAKVPGSVSAPSLKALAASPPSPETSVIHNSGRSSHVPVPVPVYCRPLTERDPGMKIWCAAGVNLTGGRTRDGGAIVGASVFYFPSSTDDSLLPIGEKSELDKLDEELKAQERDRINGEDMDHTLSSFVWICTSTHSVSKVHVIDANNPADMLESFQVCSSHILCIASVPGAKESDYSVIEELNKQIGSDLKLDDSGRCSAQEGNIEDDGDAENAEGKIGGITFVRCAVGSVSDSATPLESPTPSHSSRPHMFAESFSESLVDPSICPNTLAEDDYEDPPPSSREMRLMKEPTDVVKDGLAEVSKDNELAFEEVEKMSSVLPTMWMGSQKGRLYVHSAVAQWKRCLHTIKLRDSILSIVHVKGRVLVALADGTVAIFHRSSDGQWDLCNYHLLDLGRPYHSIRCMTVAHNKVWCGYRNQIHVIDPKTMTIEKSFDAHPRKESQVRQMAWVGDGVWVSIRLDSTLRLYHAHTYQHLQDVDIEPYVSKMLGTGKLGFSFVRITALLISCNRLWMGTGNGVIISVPLSEGSQQVASGSLAGSQGQVKGPGGVVRVYADSKDNVTPGSFIPYCSMAQAQLSFHGHRDAVKFFVSVPGHGGLNSLGGIQGSSNVTRDDGSGDLDMPRKKPKCMLVLSGGEGYIDFRIGEDEAEDVASHLIMWQVDSTE